MGTLSFPGLASSEILVQSVGECDIPGLTASPPPPRSIPSFCVAGDRSSTRSSFVCRSRRQEVTSSRDTIRDSVSIVGVNFDGPVSLSFAKETVDTNGIHIVDEGGFCSEKSPIVVETDSGDIKIDEPFSSIRLRISQGLKIPEALAPVIREDGTQVRRNPDGSTTEVDVGGNVKMREIPDSSRVVTREIRNDGTVQVSIEYQTTSASNSDPVQSTHMECPDGTVVNSETLGNGEASSCTWKSDGTIVETKRCSNGDFGEFSLFPNSRTILRTQNGKFRAEVEVYPNGKVRTKRIGYGESTIEGVATKLGASYRKYPAVGFLVNEIQQSSLNEDQVLKKFCKNGHTVFGLSEDWVRGVFRSRVSETRNLQSTWGRQKV